MHGPIKVSLDNNRKSRFDGISGCKRLEEGFYHQYQWLSYGVIILALVLFALAWKHFYQRWNQIQNRGNLSLLSNFSTAEKLEFFNLWQIASALGNLFQIFGSIIQLSTDGQVLKVTEKLIGMGWFLAWIWSLQYLRFSNDMYIIAKTMATSSIIVFKYIAGVVPVYMAYSFVGVWLFWQSDFFSGIIHAVITLFGLLQGDNMLLLFTTLTDIHLFWGMLYLFTFVVLFICVVHNIFISIIADAYNWIKDKDAQKEKPTPDKVDSFRQLKRQETKRNLKNAIYESEQDSPALDDTMNRITFMNEIQEEIEHKIAKIHDIANPDPSIEVDRFALKDKEIQLLDVELREFLRERSRNLK